MTGSRGDDDGSREDDVERRSNRGERRAGDDVLHPTAADREFGWRGYVLLAVMLLAFVVAPLVVYLRPPPLPWWVSLVLFPLLPALLLGAVAVWATTRP